MAAEIVLANDSIMVVIARTRKETESVSGKKRDAKLALFEGRRLAEGSRNIHRENSLQPNNDSLNIVRSVNGLMATEKNTHQ